MARRTAAVRAYYEWMPVREDQQTRLPRIYRTFSFGDLADLMMLDTRLVGRDQQAKKEDLKALEFPRVSLRSTRIHGTATARAATGCSTWSSRPR